MRKAGRGRPASSRNSINEPPPCVRAGNSGGCRIRCLNSLTENAATGASSGCSKWPGKPGNSWTGTGSRTGRSVSAPPGDLGLCKEKEKVVQLGRYHAAHDPPLQVTDTILHEIAHALAGTAARHGPAWRKIALRIGATPKASKAVDPAKDEAIRNGLRAGTTIDFRTGASGVLKGIVVKLNRKTARVACGNRMLLVPYGCIVEAPANGESTGNA